MGKTTGQRDLIPRYMAHEYAERLTQQMNVDEDPFGVFLLFVSAMLDDPECKKHDSFAFIHVVGLGELRNCFAWWFNDDSLILVGIPTGLSEDDMELAVGVLPPGCTFTPVPYTPEGIPTIH